MRPGDRVLGRGIGRRVGSRRVRRDRTVVDDPASARALALHHPERFLRAQECAREVDVDHGLPLLDRQLVEIDRRCADAGVVEEQVESAERLAGPCEERPHRGRISDVGGHRDRAVRRGARRRDRLLQRFGTPPGQRHRITGSEEGESDGLPDAGSGARDDCDSRGHAHVLLGVTSGPASAGAAARPWASRPARGPSPPAPARCPSSRPRRRPRAPRRNGCRPRAARKSRGRST